MFKEIATICRIDFALDQIDGRERPTFPGRKQERCRSKSPKPNPASAFQAHMLERRTSVIGPETAGPLPQKLLVGKAPYYRPFSGAMTDPEIRNSFREHR
jgi:hypothetical protein